jgi:hypothetical protein
MAVKPTKEQADFMFKDSLLQQMLSSGLPTEEKYWAYLLSEDVLSKDWNTAEEDEAWKDL